MGNAKREKLRQDFVFSFGHTDPTPFFNTEVADPFAETDAPLDAYQRSGLIGLTHGREDEVRWLLENQEYLFTLDELRAALAGFRDYLQAHASEIVSHGKPARDLSKSGWLMRRLAPLYPHEGDILSRSERDKLRKTERKKLLQLKLDVISSLIEALDAKDADLVAEKSDPILARAHQGEEAEFYLRLDRFYLGLGLRNRNWSTSPSQVIHSGGLTDILELIWHVEEELAFQINAGVREALPRGSIALGHDGYPKLTKKSPIALDQSAFAVSGHILLGYSQSIERDQRWAEFQCWVHDCLGLSVPGLRPRVIAYGRGKDIPLIFRPSNELLKIIAEQRFVPSYTYQKIVFNSEILTLTRREGQVVKVLYEDETLKRSAPDGWVKEDDIHEALGSRGELRDILWTNRHRKMREALDKKLLREEQRNGGWHYRLMI